MRLVIHLTIQVITMFAMLTVLFGFLSQREALQQQPVNKVLMDIAFAKWETTLQNYGNDMVLIFLIVIVLQIGMLALTYPYRKTTTGRSLWLAIGNATNGLMIALFSGAVFLFGYVFSEAGGNLADSTGVNALYASIIFSFCCSTIFISLGDWFDYEEPKGIE